MKGTNIGRISTQNDGTLEVLYNQTYEKVMKYINETEDVLDGKDTISAYNLYDILKDYYADLDVVMSADSEELKGLIENINSFIANGYKKVISTKKSNKLATGIDKLLGKIKDSKAMDNVGKRYLNIRFYIRQGTTSAVLEVLENNRYRKVIINRDLASEDIYYGENSMEDYEVVNFIYDDLMHLFDTIDAYRDSLPEQIDADLALDDYACRPYEYAKYSAPISSEMIMGEVFVNSNGYVDFDINLTRENNQYHYINSYSKSLKDLIRSKSMDLLKKIPIDVNSLEEPIRGIIVASLANNRKNKQYVG